MIEPFAAGIGQLLLHAAVSVSFPGIKILLCEVPVFIERFPVPQLDPLSRLRSDADFRIAREVLPEVDHPRTVRRRNEPSREPFVLPDGNAVRGGEVVISEIPHPDSVPVRYAFAARVIFLPHLQVVLPDRAFLRRLPAFVRDEGDGSGDFQLTEKGEIAPVIILQPVHADAAPVPAVAEGNGKLVLSFGEISGHVVSLYGEPFFVVPRAGSKDTVPDALSVEPGDIHTVTGDKEPRRSGY